MQGSDNDLVRSIVRSISSIRLTRYDLLLSIIPATFLLATVVATLFSTSIQRSFLAASVVGVLVLFDGLFRNPPTGDSTP